MAWLLKIYILSYLLIAFGATIEGEPWFVGKDVAKILGYRDTNRAVNQHVDSDDRKPLSRRASGDSYASLWTGEFDFSNKVVINESGMYSLVLNSELPLAIL